MSILAFKRIAMSAWRSEENLVKFSVEDSTVRKRTSYKDECNGMKFGLNAYSHSKTRNASVVPKLVLEPSKSPEHGFDSISMLYFHKNFALTLVACLKANKSKMDGYSEADEETKFAIQVALGILKNSTSPHQLVDHLSKAGGQIFEEKNVTALAKLFHPRDTLVRTRFKISMRCKEWFEGVDIKLGSTVGSKQEQLNALFANGTELDHGGEENAQDY